MDRIDYFYRLLIFNNNNNNNSIYIYINNRWFPKKCGKTWKKTKKKHPIFPEGFLFASKAWSSEALQGWKDFGCEGGAAATAAKTNTALSEVLRMDAVVPRWLGGSGGVVPRMDGWGKNYGKSPFLMGKLTISMAIFNSYVSLPEGIGKFGKLLAHWIPMNHHDFPHLYR